MAPKLADGLGKTTGSGGQDDPISISVFQFIGGWSGMVINPLVGIYISTYKDSYYDMDEHQPYSVL